MNIENKNIGEQKTRKRTIRRGGFFILGLIASIPLVMVFSQGEQLSNILTKNQILVLTIVVTIIAYFLGRLDYQNWDEYEKAKHKRACTTLYTLSLLFIPWYSLKEFGIYYENGPILIFALMHITYGFEMLFGDK